MSPPYLSTTSQDRISTSAASKGEYGFVKHPKTTGLPIPHARPKNHTQLLLRASVTHEAKSEMNQGNICAQSFASAGDSSPAGCNTGLA